MPQNPQQPILTGRILDDNGNVIGVATGRILDDNGNPIQAGSAPAKERTSAEQRMDRFVQAQQGAVTPEPFSSLTSWLPAAGGVAGGIIGSALGPVGTVAGATLGGMAGQSIRRNADVWSGASKAGTLGEEAGSVVGRGAVEGATTAVGLGMGPAMRWAGQQAVTSALKPAYKYTEKAVKAVEMPRVVKTLMDEGVNVSRGGIVKLNQILNATNKEIKDALKNATGLIDPAKAAARTQQTEQAFVNQISPESDLASIAATREGFTSTHPLTTQAQQVGSREVPMAGLVDETGRPYMKTEPVMGRGPKPISVQQAHDLKVGEYKQLQGKAYTGELKSAEVEARKAVARGLKEEIEDEVKKQGIDIAALNQREGSVIEAKDVIAKRVAAADNRDAAGLAWLAANPYTFMAYLMDRSPAIKSMIGRGLYKSAARASGIAENTIRFAVRAIASTPDEEPKK